MCASVSWLLSDALGAEGEQPGVCGLDDSGGERRRGLAAEQMSTQPLECSVSSHVLWLPRRGGRVKPLDSHQSCEGLARLRGFLLLCAWLLWENVRGMGAAIESSEPTPSHTMKNTDPLAYPYPQPPAPALDPASAAPKPASTIAPDLQDAAAPRSLAVVCAEIGARIEPYAGSRSGPYGTPYDHSRYTGGEVVTVLYRLPNDFDATFGPKNISDARIVGVECGPIVHMELIPAIPRPAVAVCLVP